MTKYYWDEKGKPGERWVEYEKPSISELPPRKTPYIMSDIPEYISPITGRPVDGRAARREDLKRSGSREVDPSERLEMNPKTQAQAQAERKQLAEREKTAFNLSKNTKERLLGNG